MKNNFLYAIKAVLFIAVSYNFFVKVNMPFIFDNIYLTVISIIATVPLVKENI